MSRSHKLLVATAMLLVGYGLALVVSGLSDFLWARQLVSGESSVATAGEWGRARLVPEASAIPARTDSARRSERPQSNTAARAEAKPTWLSPVVPASWDDSSGARRDGTGSAANTEPKSSLALAEEAVDAEPEPIDRGPRARLTDVKKTRPTSAHAASDGQTRSASPWDRWPRWEPPEAKLVSDSPESDGPSSATSGANVSGQSWNPAPSARETSVDDLSGFSTAELAGLRTHIVVDGDSLGKLADRYLDDPELGDAIYQFNREVLNDPTLLPIGTELKIPARRMARSLHLSPPSGANRQDEVEPAGRPLVSNDDWSPLGSTADSGPRIRRLPPLSQEAPATNRPLPASW